MTIGSETAREYGMSVRLQAPFGKTVERVNAALKDQGFGVLTEIEHEGGTLVEALGPQTMAHVTGQVALEPIADEAAHRLKAVLEAL